MSEPRTVLSIQAHPDDTDFFAGGAVANLAEKGSRVVYVTVTDGSMGTLDPSTKPKDLVRIREDEQKRAAEVLGVERVVFLRYPDSELYPNLRLRGKLIRTIREVKPDIVLTLDPWKPYEAHPDHRATGLMAYEAAAFAALPHVNSRQLRSGLRTHLVREVHFFNTECPNIFVSISRTMKKKIRALRCHQSQGGSLMAEAAVKMNTSIGKRIGRAYAESFKVVKRSFPRLYE